MKMIGKRWIIGLLLGCSVSALAAEKPNVLFIAIDDMNDWTTLFDRNNPIQTPNLERLAARGVFFSKAYCVAAACCPSRGAVLSGLRPETTGLYDNGKGGWEKFIDPAQTPFIPQYFAKFGYTTRGAGKILHGTQNLKRCPTFQEFGPGGNDYSAKRTTNLNGYLLTDNKYLSARNYDWGEYDAPWQPDEKTVGYVNGMLSSLPADRPFFLAAGIRRPHLPFYAPPSTFSRYPFDQVRQPPMPPNDLADVPRLGIRMAHREGFVYQTASQQPADSPGSLKKMVQCYQAAADFSDEMVGRLLDQLDATGRADNTIIVLWSDHGYHLGDKESCVKFTLWEKANHVPFIIVAPGVTTPGSRCDRPVSLLDIYPTLVELAGLPEKKGLDGTSLVPLLKNPQAEWKRPAVMTMGQGNHAVRTDRWRYIQYADGSEELYDQSRDPWDITNLADHAEYAEVISSQKQWLPKGGAAPSKSVPQRKVPGVDDPDALVVADFEGGTYGDWTVEGAAFGSAPARANVSPPNKVTGYRGRRLVNSYLGGDKPVGSLTSPPFMIERKYINFLVGGGNHSGETCMNLLVYPPSSDSGVTSGKAVRTAAGSARKDKGREVMEWTSWNVEEFMGKKAILQIVDNHSGGWGHINIDHIVQSDRAAVPSKNLIPLSASFRVEGTHLHVPVMNAAGRDKDKFVLLGIYDGKRLVQNFTVSLPGTDDAFWMAAYPLEHFGLQGKRITIKPMDGRMLPDRYKKAFGLICCGDDLALERTEDYAKPYRNQFHASTRRGWNNDPNGMVYYNGKYHLYYQYNPFGIFWGNMHWGHFESEDLIHWEEKPIALYQKTVKDMAFSGGGFVDSNDSAGLGKDTLFAAFTSTGRGECLAYSKDGGLTFKELPENPVVKHRGRDPQVFWYGPEKKWVMVVYDTSECAETQAVPSNDPDKKFNFSNVAFYESKNLRQWKRTGAFTDPERHACHECPQLFKLPIIGKPGASRWVLYGAQNRYFIGHFDGKTFTKESGPHGSRHGSFYAAQTFSDVPDGRRIQIGWVRTASYVGRFPDQLVNQAFTLPHELTLRKTSDGLRLAFNPVKEVETLRGEEFQSLEKCSGELTEVLIEFEEDGWHELMINGINASFEGRRARIFTDRTLNEVYADDGLYYEVRQRSPENFDSTETVVKTGTVKSVRGYRLKSIWPQ